MTTNALICYHLLKYAGLREVAGSGSHPLILKMIRKYFPNWKDDSTIAWCSVFANYVAEECGVENTSKLEFPGLARGWLKVGQPIELDDLEPGDIVVFWRESPSSWKAHVSFFCRRNGSNLTVFGGNQSNEVTESDYPVSRFLGGRRLRKDDGAYPKN